MLKYAKGNLIDMAENGDFDVIVHGCNCFNTMGGGIAREIATRYPYAAQIDNGTKRGDYMKLGTWTESEAGDYFDNVNYSRNNKLRFGDPKRFTIINAYTQYSMSRGFDVFEYVAFDLILQKLLHHYGDKRIGLPYIGMGLAGGDEHTIISMIEDWACAVASKGGTVTLVEFGG